MYFLNRFKRYIFSDFLLFVLDSWQVVLAQATEANLLKALETTPIEDHDSIYYELFKVNMYDDLQKANHYAQRCFSLASSHSHYLMVVKSLRAQAYCNNELGYNDSTKYYYRLCIELSRKYNASSILSHAQNDLGIYFENRDIYDSALWYYSESLETAKRYDLYDDQAISLNNIGLIFYYLGNLQEADHYFRLSIALREKSGDPERLTDLINLCMVLNDHRKYLEAMEIIDSVKLKCEQFDCELKVINGINYSLGVINLEQNNLDASLNYFSQSYTQSEALNNKRFQSSCLWYEAKIYRRKENFDKALKLLNESESLAEEANSKRMLKDIYELRKEIYTSLGDSIKALEASNKSLVLKMEIINPKVIANLRRIELMNQQEQSNQIIQQKEEQLSQFQLIIIFVTIITLLLGIVSVLLYKRYILNKRLKQILEKQVRLRTSDLVHNNSELKQLNAEYEMLLQQTSKYVKGPLATLMGLIELAEKDRDPERTQEYIVKIKKIASSMGLSLEQLKAIAELRVSDQENRRDLLKQNLVTQDQHN